MDLFRYIIGGWVGGCFRCLGREVTGGDRGMLDGLCGCCCRVSAVSAPCSGCV